MHRIYLPSSSKPKRAKSHYGLYEKHDDFLENPALNMFLMDADTSVLARVLRKYSPAQGWDTLSNGDLLKAAEEAGFISGWRLIWHRFAPKSRTKFSRMFVRSLSKRVQDLSAMKMMQLESG